jgi:Photosynthetic reaction centre cytochrome C subunit
MNSDSPRLRLYFLMVVLTAILVGAASLSAQAPGQTSGEFYKNVQVLKAMPANLMQPTMQLMEISLGVHCNYCHDNDNTKRELETKPQKAIARRMLQMVADLNRTQFAGREVVTCFTCHHGSTKPTTALPYNGEEDRPEIAQAPGQAPTPDQLIDRFIAAVGGAEVIAKVPARTLKGTVMNYAHIDQVHPERAPTTVTPIDLMVKGPDKRMVVQHNIAADAVQTLNGTTGWVRNGNAAPGDLRADLAEVARLENAVMVPTQLKQLLTNLKVEGQEKVGERTAWVVSGSSQWMPQVRLYFDRDTAYLLSVTYQQKSNFCCHVFRIDYDNFYVSNGVRVPTQWTVNGPRESILVYRFETVDTNAIDDSRFARPAGATASR